MELFGPVIRGLGGALDLYHARHGVISENLANVETPGYRAHELSFGDELDRAFASEPAVEDSTGPGDGGRGELLENRGARVKIDGNSVDIDSEMSRMSDNTLKMLALTRILGRKYGGLRNLVRELGQ